MGHKRWLEVAVRPSADSGSYVPLAPRQELAPAPAALFSANAATVGGLACANGQVARWDGGWMCGPDLDTNSGGTVTSVATGTALTGVPIVTAGTVSVATGGITTGLLGDAAVTSPKIAAGAVGLAHINTAEVQARVGTTCPPGQYLRGISPGGAPVCEPFFVPNLTTTVAAPGGHFTAVVIGTDGLPVISHQNPHSTRRSLEFVHCGNPPCTAGNTTATVDDPSNGNDVGSYVSMAIGADGLPVISRG